ncbi:hypothetical protein [Agarivorans sp. Z349TD_8]|uniref:hypothetical protein n=1 Tax=Agarivorans sp. Z349TD_8 TaxID=3421434 RepID=UPI003D7CC658
MRRVGLVGGANRGSAFRTALGFIGVTPIFEFTLYDNPTGINGLGSGSILDKEIVSGSISAADTFDWTTVQIPLDTLGNTNGNVTQRIDLLAGGYAALDSIRIVASDVPGDMQVPEPSSACLMILGLFGLTASR